jgi:hypothetical protein
MANTIKIKRRIQGDAGPPASLANGELAYNEVNNTLYYGASAGIIPLGGAGVYVTALSATVNSPLESNFVYGEKTFAASAYFQRVVITNEPNSLSNDDTVPTTYWVRQRISEEVALNILDAGDF